MTFRLVGKTGGKVNSRWGGIQVKSKAEGKVNKFRCWRGSEGKRMKITKRKVT